MRKLTNEDLKNIMMYHAITSLMLEQADAIEKTPFFNGKLKQVLNLAKKQIEKQVDKVFQYYDNPVLQKQYFDAVKIPETFSRMLESTRLEDIDSLIDVMNEAENELNNKTQKQSQ